MAKVKQTKKNNVLEIVLIALLFVLVTAGVIVGIIQTAKPPQSEGELTGQTDGKDENASEETEENDGLYQPKALDENKTYYADMEIEQYGKITVRLDQKSAPITAANFVELAGKGFYDGLTFHRIIEGFMMQGGDPNGNGTGGTDYNIKGEFSANGVQNPLSHTRGALSMARATPFDSASCQFFIVHKDYPSLDGAYAVFGYVTEGMDVVDAICTEATPTDSNGTIPAAEQPVIKTLTVRAE